MIVAETLDTPWTQFYDQVSAAMDKTYQLDDAVLGYLDTQLQSACNRCARRCYC